MRKCKECGYRAFGNETKCKDCGAILPALKNNNSKLQESDPRNGLCHYHDGDEYCPLPGSVKEGGVWLCRWHFRARNDSGLSQQILFDVQRPGGLNRYLAQINRDLRYETEHKQHAAENDTARHPGETMKEYEHRMIGQICKMVGATPLLKTMD